MYLKTNSDKLVIIFTFSQIQYLSHLLINKCINVAQLKII